MTYYDTCLMSLPARDYTPNATDATYLRAALRRLAALAEAGRPESVLAEQRAVVAKIARRFLAAEDQADATRIAALISEVR